MSTHEAPPRGSRETRLLLVTIAVSVGVLLLLARFRFPEERSGHTVESAPAPLERLAARVTYDELATTMADLERRLSGRIVVLRTTGSAGQESLAVAPRILPDRAVALVEPDHRITGSFIARDATGISVVRVPAMDESAVTLRTGTPRTGPRYVGIVEAADGGVAVTPLYVGRIDVSRDEATGATLWKLVGLQQRVRRGAALFTLEGAFIGLIVDAGDPVVVVTGEYLREAAGRAQETASAQPGPLGVRVDALTPALSRATGADRGVIVTDVIAPARSAGLLQPGDVIQEISGTPITSAAEFHDVERGVSAAESVAVGIVRRGSRLSVPVPPLKASAPTAASHGTGLSARSLAGARIEILSVEAQSAGARAGLQRGDVIVSIDGEPARDLGVVERRFASAKPGAALLLAIRRGPDPHVVALEKR